jgi:Flp pilus assembly protein TadG
MREGVQGVSQTTTEVSSRALRWRESRGAAAVEFAILVPIFIVIVFGIVDFGLMFYSKTVITNAAREGARTASLSGDLAAVTAAVTTAVGSLPGSAPAVSTTCKTATNTACTNWGNSGVSAPSGGTVDVMVAYTYPWLTPIKIFVPGLGNSKALSSNSTMVVE